MAPRLESPARRELQSALATTRQAKLHVGLAQWPRGGKRTHLDIDQRSDQQRSLRELLWLHPETSSTWHNTGNRGRIRLTDRGDGGDRDDPLDDIDFEEFQLNDPESYDAPLDYEEVYEQAPATLISCPSCGTAQSATNRHCEQCGARLGSGSVPVAPRPLATASAGTRALTIILAVLSGVVLIALLYTGLRSDDGPGANGASATSQPSESTPTTGPSGPVSRIPPIDIVCSTQLNATNLACDNLVDGTTEYWNDLSLRGDSAVITVTFARPVQLEQVQFVNIENDANFRRNYRIRGVQIIADDLPGLPFLDEIPNDNDRPHSVTTLTLGTTQLIIRITSTWPSEAINGRAFDELALDEIEFWGREAEHSTPEADNTGG